jgi:hypothetical protein
MSRFQAFFAQILWIEQSCKAFVHFSRNKIQPLNCMSALWSSSLRNQIFIRSLIANPLQDRYTFSQHSSIFHLQRRNITLRIDLIVITTSISLVLQIYRNKIKPKSRFTQSNLRSQSTSTRRKIKFHKKHLSKKRSSVIVPVSRSLNTRKNQTPHGTILRSTE